MLDDMTKSKRRACHWTVPNGIPASQWAADDELHVFTGSFAQPYEQWLEDGEWTPEQKPIREYRLRQLRDVPSLHSLVEQAERQAVDRARSEGATWQQIGEALGITRQAAQMRFGGAK